MNTINEDNVMASRSYSFIVSLGGKTAIWRVDKMTAGSGVKISGW